MRDDRPSEDEAEAPEHPGLLQRMGHAVTVRELQLIDSSIGLFERWRHRLAPPEDEDDRHGRRGAEAAAAPAAVPAEGMARHGRRRGFLIVVALLLATGIGGMLFSYALFSRMLETDDLVIDDLRDQMEQMQKADARNLAIQAKDQQQIAEQKKTLREYAVKVQDYEDQVAELRKKIVALTPPPPPPPKREPLAGEAPSRPWRTPRPSPPQKTGKCNAGGKDAAGDVARCVEEFNRP
ncbi:MAG TPA: hypothetical protein VF816_08460 [Rhodocyclaceae bacterium]